MNIRKHTAIALQPPSTYEHTRVDDGGSIFLWSAEYIPSKKLRTQLVCVMITAKEKLKIRLVWLGRGCLPDTSGERLNGIQEVSGSIPLISIKK